MLGRDPFRNDHAPGVDHQLAHLGGVDRGEAYPDPVVAEVGGDRHQELVRLAGDERLPLLLRIAEAHQRLVTGEGHVDEAAYPELHAVAYQSFFGTRQRQRECADLVDCDGHYWKVCASDGKTPPRTSSANRFVASDSTPCRSAYALTNRGA